MINDQPWFVAQDICQILEISNVSQALERLDVDERSTIILNEGITAGNPNMNIISESGMYALVLSSRKPEAKPFRKWVTSEILPTIRKTGRYESKPIVTLEQKSAPVTDETVKVHSNAIAQFENSGDLQLAQLLKSRLGNLILAEQQQLLKPVDVPQYEGVIDVAIRLGYNVPSNYEGALGVAVKKNCGHLMVGHNKRYSTASHKQICAGMYPAGNKQVEEAVTEYCLNKVFYHQDIKLID